MPRSWFSTYTRTSYVDVKYTTLVEDIQGTYWRALVNVLEPNGVYHSEFVRTGYDHCGLTMTTGILMRPDEFSLTGCTVSQARGRIHRLFKKLYGIQ